MADIVLAVKNHKLTWIIQNLNPKSNHKKTTAIQRASKQAHNQTSWSSCEALLRYTASKLSDIAELGLTRPQCYKPTGNFRKKQCGKIDFHAGLWERLSPREGIRFSQPIPQFPRMADANNTSTAKRKRLAALEKRQLSPITRNASDVNKKAQPKTPSTARKRNVSSVVGKQQSPLSARGTVGSGLLLSNFQQCGGILWLRIDVYDTMQIHVVKWILLIQN